MGFKEDMLILANQVGERISFVKNEETTKHSLIVPFIQTLGYDVFNPVEVRPEYSADFGKRKAEKVDYAILSEDNPTMFIEAKKVNDSLTDHDAQLSRYFNSTPNVKLAILTNGINYKFFTDLKISNIMDDRPFFELDVLNLNDYSISILQKFHKESFEADQIFELATELNNISNINSTLRDLFENPTDEFIRFLVKDISKDRLTANVIERFRPIVKKSIKEALLEIISQGILQHEINEKEPINQVQSCKENESEVNLEPKQNKPLFASPEELETFEIVKKILLAYGKNVEEINFKKTSHYFVIYYKGINRWFLRLTLGSSKRLITRLPIDIAKNLCTSQPVEPAHKDSTEARIIITNNTNIRGLKSLIVTCFDRVEKDILKV